MNYDAILKRARKAVEKVESKLHSAKVHLVDNDTDTSKLSGLVIILHPSITSKPHQTSQEATGEDFEKNMG